jgi:Topoisomerase IB
VRLLDTTLIRVGNEEYARQNRSYGLTTLRTEHAAVRGSVVTLHFTGKSGKEHTIDLQDRRLARIIRRCQELPGQELFQYADESGELRRIDSDDVNEYLRAAAGGREEFSAKDFRTWGGTVLAVCALQECGPCASVWEARANIVGAIDRVIVRLGNTRSVCRQYYIHPAVFAAYEEGVLPLRRFPASGETVAAETAAALRPEERAVQSFLKRYLKATERPTREKQGGLSR